MELSTKQKLQSAMRDNPNPRTIMAYLKYEEKEASFQLKRVAQEKDFRYIQGKLAILDELIDLLTKAVS